jgi:hypothetical protein
METVLPSETVVPMYHTVQRLKSCPWPSTVKNRVRSWSTACGTCGRSGAGTRISPSTSLFSCHYQLTNAPHSHSIHLLPMLFSLGNWTVQGSSRGTGNIIISWTLSHRLCAPPSLLSNGYRDSFPGVKRLGCERNHSPLSGTEFKNDWFYFVSLHVRLYAFYASA